MAELERILRLLKEGRIDREEAERLIAALGEVAPAAREAGRLFLDVDRADVVVRPARGGEVTAVAHGEGRLELEQEGGEARLRFRAAGARGFGPIRLVGLGGKASRIEVGLPAGWGAVLKLGMGAFEAGALGFLEGEVGLGTVAVEGLLGLDLKLGKGRFSAGLALAEGEHRVAVGMGEVAIRPLPGASFRVEGRVGTGRVEARVFGEGRARLLVEIGVGRLEVGA